MINFQWWRLIKFKLYAYIADLMSESRLRARWLTTFKFDWNPPPPKIELPRPASELWDEWSSARDARSTAAVEQDVEDAADVWLLRMRWALRVRSPYKLSTIPGGFDQNSGDSAGVCSNGCWEEADVATEYWRFKWEGWRFSESDTTAGEKGEVRWVDGGGGTEEREVLASSSTLRKIDDFVVVSADPANLGVGRCTVPCTVGRWTVPCTVGRCTVPCTAGRCTVPWTVGRCTVPCAGQYCIVLLFSLSCSAPGDSRTRFWQMSSL